MNHKPVSGLSTGIQPASSRWVPAASVAREQTAPVNAVAETLETVSTPPVALSPVHPAGQPLPSLAMEAPNDATDVAQLEKALRGLHARGSTLEANVNGDSRLDASDLAILKEVSESALSELRRREHIGHRITPGQQFPEPDAVFQKLKLDKSGELNVKSLSMPELRTLSSALNFLTNRARLALALGDGTAPAELGGAFKSLLGLPPDTSSISLSALIDAIERTDFQALEEKAGVPLIVGSDIDSTVIAQETYIGFIAHLAKKGFFNASHKKDIESFLTRINEKRADGEKFPITGDPNQDALTIARNTNNNNGRFISAGDSFLNVMVNVTRGMSRHQLLVQARDYVRNGTDADGKPIRTSFLKDEQGRTMKDVFDALRAKGVEVYFNTANLSTIAQAVVEQMGGNEAHILATELDLDREGKSLGRMTPFDLTPGRHEQSKYDRFLRIVEGLPLMYFGDSPGSDGELATQAPVAGFSINRHALKREAAWEKKEHEAGAASSVINIELGNTGSLA